MANNFKILIHRNETCVHLKLHGEVDEKAAQDLVNMVKRRGRTMSRVFLHTSSLNEVHSGGAALFKDRCEGFRGASTSLILTGEYADRLALRGSMRF